jgi:hypothetical protein
MKMVFVPVIDICHLLNTSVVQLVPSRLALEMTEMNTPLGIMTLQALKVP